MLATTMLAALAGRPPAGYAATGGSMSGALGLAKQYRPMLVVDNLSFDVCSSVGALLDAKALQPGRTTVPT
jgi:hypothetical protein